MKKNNIESKDNRIQIEDFNDLESLSDFEDDTVESDWEEEKVSEEYAKSSKSSKSSKKKKDVKNTKSNSVGREILSWIMTFAIAIAIALVLKEYVIINATVPTGSMENTIMPDDNLFGFRLAYLNSDPQRGDVIIFKYPDNEKEKYIKRVIGLPGDTITIDDGKIYINDETEPLQEDYLKEEWVKGTGPYVFQVPDNSYFVMGDNRNNSWDARYWNNTYVSKDKILGKALFIYYPFQHFGTFDK